MPTKRTVRKVRTFLMAVTAVAMIASLVYSIFLNDRSKEALERRAVAMQRCAHLHLTMTRDEVLQVMGPPFKEYAVRPAGRGGAVLYDEMIFRMPLSSLPAYVDLDPDVSRVVEISCSLNATVSLPLAQRTQLKSQENGPLPSSTP